MKRFILMLLTGLLFSVGICLAQEEGISDTPDYANYFATFIGVSGVVGVITEAIKKLFSTEPNQWTQRIMSWTIGIAVAMFAWVFHLGMFEGLLWWQSLLWGFAAGLASNGIFDTGLIEWLFSLFTKKK